MTASMHLEMAENIYKAACEMPLYIDAKNMFAGLWDKDRICDYIQENALGKYINGTAKIIGDMLAHSRTASEQAACDTMSGWGGANPGHTNPDYALPLSMGTDGLRKKVERFRHQNPGKDEFYDSMLITFDAIDKLAERYAALAREQSKLASEQERAALLRMADALDIVPKKPAHDFFTACQAFWLVFCFDGIDSPGRFDQYMYPYYKNSCEKDRRDCLEALWQLFHNTRTWNLCIGGSDEYFHDTSNALSYEILDVAAKFKFNTPNLSLRVHRNTPASLLQKAVEVLAEGIGMPTLYNDEIVCPALEAIGIRTPDAHLYCLNGCNQIDIMGKSHMGLEDGEVSLIKCLEYALFDGVCQITGKQVGLNTGANFLSFDDFFCAYKKQVEYITDLCISMANKAQEVYATHSVNPFKSAMYEGCMEKGLDYKAGATIYNHGQILTEGIADTADSLAVIKHFVYESKQLTMHELTKILCDNFVGHDVIYNKFKKFSKFGNNDDYVDRFAKDIIDHFFSYLLTKKTYRGGLFGGGCSTWQRAPDFGRAVGAMPSGKLRGTPTIADSIAAVPGNDMKGPTALINSVLKYNHTLAKSGFVFNIKFDKKMLATQKGKDGFLHLAKVFFQEGGQQLSVNVVSAEDLRNARANPDAYKNLIVRVAGYSDYFLNLSEDLQDSIINRTEHMM